MQAYNDRVEEGFAAHRRGLNNLERAYTGSQRSNSTQPTHPKFTAPRLIKKPDGQLRDRGVSVSDRKVAQPDGRDRRNMMKNRFRSSTERVPSMSLSANQPGYVHVVDPQATFEMSTSRTRDPRSQSVQGYQTEQALATVSKALSEARSASRNNSVNNSPHYEDRGTSALSLHDHRSIGTTPMPAETPGPVGILKHNTSTFTQTDISAMPDVMTASNVYDNYDGENGPRMLLHENQGDQQGDMEDGEEKLEYTQAQKERVQVGVFPGALLAQIASRQQEQKTYTVEEAKESDDVAIMSSVLNSLEEQLKEKLQLLSDETEHLQVLQNENAELNSALVDAQSQMESTLGRAEASAKEEEIEARTRHEREKQVERAQLKSHLKVIDTETEQEQESIRMTHDNIRRRLKDELAEEMGQLELAMAEREKLQRLLQRESENMEEFEQEEAELKQERDALKAIVDARPSTRNASEQVNMEEHEREMMTLIRRDLAALNQKIARQNSEVGAWKSKRQNLDMKLLLLQKEHEASLREEITDADIKRQEQKNESMARRVAKLEELWADVQMKKNQRKHQMLEETALQSDGTSPQQAGEHIEEQAAQDVEDRGRDFSPPAIETFAPQIKQEIEDVSHLEEDMAKLRALRVDLETLIQEELGQQQKQQKEINRMRGSLTESLSQPKQRKTRSNDYYY